MSKFINSPSWVISNPRNSRSFNLRNNSNSEQFKNLPIFGISMVFQIEQIEECQTLFILQVGKFLIWKIPKNFNLQNNSNSEQYKNLPIFELLMVF